jgi:ribonuclease J
MLKPKLIVPMHGEHRHMREHKVLAESNGFRSIIVPNGSMIEIESNGNAQIIDKISIGRIYLDGGQLINSLDGVVKTRLQMASRGHLSISLLLEKNVILNDGVWVKLKGLPETVNLDDNFETLLEDSLEMELTMLGDKDLYDDDLLEGQIRRVVNKVCQKVIGRKPVITIFINRID